MPSGEQGRAFPLAAGEEVGAGAATGLATVAYFGGNGHATARLSAVYRAHDELVKAGEIAPFATLEAPYPGFEGRPRAANLEAFLDALMQAFAAPPALLVGTGIGGLLALCLRARGALLDRPLLLHAPVLWGLERRWMPRVLRWAPARSLLHPLFAAKWYQRRFVRKQFVVAIDDGMREAFFDGYARCSAFADLFEWLTPALLRRLEAAFAANPSYLDNITVWWGQRDHVVSPRELEITEQALQRKWPLKLFPNWAHYPMIEQPHEWVRALSDELRRQQEGRLGQLQGDEVGREIDGQRDEAR